jgi:hypothetical protein
VVVCFSHDHILPCGADTCPDREGAQTCAQRLRLADPETRSTVRRTASAAIIVALALGSLSGCFALPQATDGAEEQQPTSSPTPKAERYSEYAEVGDCWQSTFLRLKQATTWSGGAAVDCAKEHQTYTYFVGELGFDDEHFYSAIHPTDLLLDAANELCASEFLEQFQAPVVPGRLSWFGLPPTRAEWKAGEHRIRCDMVLLPLGSDYLDPSELDNLPDNGDLKRAIEAGDYELCLTGDGYHPYDEEETDIVDCSDDDYYWRLDSYSVYDAADTVPYPGESAIDEFAWSRCDEGRARKGEELFYYGIDEDSWNYGYRVTECWFTTVCI